MDYEQRRHQNFLTPHVRSDVSKRIIAVTFIRAAAVWIMWCVEWVACWWKSNICSPGQLLLKVWQGWSLTSVVKPSFFFFFWTSFSFVIQVYFSWGKNWLLIPNISLTSDRIPLPPQLSFFPQVALIFCCFLTFLLAIVFNLSEVYIQPCLCSPAPSPRGPDRHATITPSCEPTAFFFSPFHIP